MIYSYPIKAHETRTYSSLINDYTKLTKEDKKILVNDIVEFTKYIYWYQNLPCPTYSQQYMSRYVGKIAHTTDRLMLQAQRGLAKSLTSQILAAWLLLRNKEEKLAVLSATKDRAASWTSFLLNLFLTIPLLKHLYPTGSKQRSSSSFFDVNGCLPSDSPSVGAYSITGQKTGMRGTFLIYDDVEILENSDTVGKREKLSKGVREATNLGIANVYRSLCLCTPQSSETIYEEMLDRGYKRTVLPAEYPEDISVYNGDLAPFIQEKLKANPELVGEPTDERHDHKHLALKKMETTRAEYKLQYMLDTTLTDEERYPLKLRDLIVMDLEPDKAPIQIIYSSDKSNALWDIKHKGFKGDSLYSPKHVSYDKVSKYEGIAMFVDPSGRGKDETAYCITAQLNGRIYLLDFGGLTGGYDTDALTNIASIAKFYNVNLIQVESNFGDGTFAELLKPVVSSVYKEAYRGSYDSRSAGVCIEDVRATTNKERRIIETLEPVVMQHRLIVNKSSLVRDSEKQGDYSFTYQYTHIMNSVGCLKHDDIVDVVEMGVSYWQKSLARNTEEAIKEHERQEKIKMLKELEEKRRKNRIQVEPRRTPLDAF